MRISRGKILFPFLSTYLLLCVYLYLSEKRTLSIKLFSALFFPVLTFGVVSLVYVVIDVYRLDNSPEHYFKLMKEVKNCATDLESMGFSFKKFGINLRP